MKPVICPIYCITLKISNSNTKYWIFNISFKNSFILYCYLIPIFAKINLPTLFIKERNIKNFCISRSKSIYYISSKICSCKPINIFTTYNFLIILNNSLENFFTFFFLRFMCSPNFNAFDILPIRTYNSNRATYLFNLTIL